jgi:hypothetical protein
VPWSTNDALTRAGSVRDWAWSVGVVAWLGSTSLTLVVGVVALQAAQESERATRRRARMNRVLRAAGIKVFIWREVAIPDAESARAQVLQRTGEVITSPATAEIESLQPVAPKQEKIPVADVLAETPADGLSLEPPSSTWFDNLDSGAMPLDAERKRPGA